MLIELPCAGPVNFTIGFYSGVCCTRPSKGGHARLSPVSRLATLYHTVRVIFCVESTWSKRASKPSWLFDAHIQSGSPLGEMMWSWFSKTKIKRYLINHLQEKSLQYIHPNKPHAYTNLISSTRRIAHRPCAARARRRKDKRQADRPAMPRSTWLNRARFLYSILEPALLFLVSQGAGLGHGPVRRSGTASTTRSESFPSRRASLSTTIARSTSTPSRRQA